jgi:hypothetical protein
MAGEVYDNKAIGRAESHDPIVNKTTTTQVTPLPELYQK